MPPDTHVKLRIVLESPPAGVAFGLQKGRGSIFETVETQISDGKDLSFDFIPVLQAGSKFGNASFSGPFVQGPRDGRFVYIDIGTVAGQAGSPWSRRLKVPLSGITQAMVDQVMTDDGLILEARVPGTGRDGGPACASVKDFEGWQVRRTGEDGSRTFAGPA